MNVSGSTQSMRQSLADFLKVRKTDPCSPKHYVLGNEAGDADSIISAISLAYIDSVQQDVAAKTPLISIPRADLATQRPETALLLDLAGVSHAVDDLLFIDDPIIVDDNDVNEIDPAEVKVTLVDHNRLKEVFQEKHWKVQEIVDHHYDEGDHTDSCSGAARHIAFADNKALVASTCTIMVERLQETWDPPYPVSVGVLLLGVILLDSVNMIPKAGKGTPRDGAAIETLLDHTDWQDLSPRAAAILKVSSETGKPDTQAFFDALQNAKFDPSFWKALSVRDALRLDYKRFSTENSGTSISFGVSTVLLPMPDFVSKSNLVDGLQGYMQEADVDFLGVMLTYTVNSSGLGRQLVLCGRNPFPLEEMVKFINEQGGLSLTEVSEDALSSSCMDIKDNNDENGLTLRLFNQGNTKASRKQVAPILLQFFESDASGDSKL
jgi:exopolyphosphatase